MKIDIKHIAKLSRLSLTQKEEEKFTPQMETILESASVLQEVDTSKVQPMKARIPFDNLREDTPKKSLEQDDVLKNAPHSEDGHIKVYGEIFGGIEES
ncbi:MAG: Asp-tRNA(Asn)/Glu-tRNA(Gln) amidotransferase subunit GatC [Candidatus Dojkabacteria bacterium]